MSRAGLRVRPPKPGRAVLACRCGRVLDAAQLCRPAVRWEGTGGVSIAPIVCGVCAVRR